MINGRFLPQERDNVNISEGYIYFTSTRYVMFSNLFFRVNFCKIFADAGILIAIKNKRMQRIIDANDTRRMPAAWKPLMATAIFNMLSTAADHYA